MDHIVYLREDEKVTGPVQSDPLNAGVYDVDPFERVRIQ